jgi:heptosyltransferase-1
MRVLIIKMSSMGDVIHTLPALTDAVKAIKDITFDWVVEENFQEIPLWHPQVNAVIPIALRRWRKKIFSADTRREFKQFVKKLREQKYDLIIDAQGLLKSAVVARIAKGVVAGPDSSCARDPLSAIFYQKKYTIGKVKTTHAVTRARQLFSRCLGYELPDSVADYGVDRDKFRHAIQNEFLVFLHGTTWATKHWPENYWIELAKMAVKKGYAIKVPWGTTLEHERALRMAAACDKVEVLPKLNLKEIASVLASAKAIVSVDTGLGHLAAALDVPTVSLYGPTDPELTGALGRSQILLKTPFSCSPCFNRECTFVDAKSYAEQPPCFTTLPPAFVWNEVEKL